MSVNAMFFFMIRCDKICSKRFVENTSQDMVSVRFAVFSFLILLIAKIYL